MSSGNLPVARAAPASTITIWQTARHQDWVGGDGTILHLHGGMRDGSMILTGETKGTKGPVVNRITSTLLPEGQSETGMGRLG